MGPTLGTPYGFEAERGEYTSAAVDAAAGVERDLDALADRLRARWPDARLILRTDSGYCREEILLAKAGKASTT